MLEHIKQKRAYVYKKPSEKQPTFNPLSKLGVPIRETPPSDEKAKRIKDSWKERSLAPPIALLIGDQKDSERIFLGHIAAAIDTLIAPCRTVAATPLEQDKKWDIFLSSKELKHIIAPDSVLTGNLITYLREPGEGKRFLGEKPLFLLPDLALYLKDPLLKKHLWSALCRVLSPSS